MRKPVCMQAIVHARVNSDRFETKEITSPLDHHIGTPIRNSVRQFTNRHVYQSRGF